jgi:8-oxo-dGTP diphosphatase
MEETGITGVALEQLGAFGDPGRDPRGHTVSAVFYSFLVADIQPVAADDAADAAWKPLRSLSRVKLAFDHALIIDVARRRLQERLVDPARQAPFEIVPARFTLTELQRVYEAVLGKTLDRRAFRARLIARGIVEPVARGEGGRKTASSQLYGFKPSGLA